MKLQEHKQKLADVTLSEGNGKGNDLASRRLEVCHFGRVSD